jgi:hypothetical protein
MLKEEPRIVQIHSSPRPAPKNYLFPATAPFSRQPQVNTNTNTKHQINTKQQQQQQQFIDTDIPIVLSIHPLLLPLHLFILVPLHSSILSHHGRWNAIGDVRCVPHRSSRHG